MRISDWSSDVCSSDLVAVAAMHLDKIETDALGALDRTDMGGGQFLDFRFGQFPRRGIVAERNGGRPNGLPSSFVRRHGLAAKRRRVLRAFAAGMEIGRAHV